MTRAMLLALTVLGSLPLVSCRPHLVVVQHDVAASSRDELVVAEPPPPLPKEAVPASPSPGHVWVAGYWTWRYNGWVWVAGCHVLRPSHHAVWVSGTWERHPRGWVWIYGRWS